MNNETVLAYESPRVEVIEVEVEKGFATSGEAQTNELPGYGYEQGGF